MKLRDAKNMTWKQFSIRFIAETAGILEPFYFIAGWATIGCVFLLCALQPDISLNPIPPAWSIIGAFGGFIGFIFLWLRERLMIIEKNVEV